MHGDNREERRMQCGWPFPFCQCCSTSPDRSMLPHSRYRCNVCFQHMTCKKCKYEFCWICMGEWSAHGTSWYNCNRYDDKKETGKDATSKSRASLERYLHVSENTYLLALGCFRALFC